MFETYAETDELRNFCFSSCPKQNEVYLILFFSAVVVQNTTNSPSIYGKYSGRIRSIVEVNITYETIMNKLVTTIKKAIINNILTISYNKQIRRRSQKWLERWRAQVQVPSGWICFRQSRVQILRHACEQPANNNINFITK